MGFLVSKNKYGVKRTYSGTQYVNPTEGNKRFCVRTGTGINDIIKYGLTSNSSASNYCGLKMRIDGNTAYIGRSQIPIISSSYSNINSSTTSSTGGTSRSSTCNSRSPAITSSSIYTTKTSSGLISSGTRSETITSDINGVIRSGSRYVSSQVISSYSSLLRYNTNRYGLTSYYRETVSQTTSSFLTIDEHNLEFEGDKEDNFNL